MSLEDLSFEARDELAALARQMSEDPSTREAFLMLTKKVRPNLNIPELDVKHHTEKAVSSAYKRVEELEAKLREKEALEDLDKRRTSLMKKGLARSESDVEAIEKVMLDEGITNHEAAAKYWAWMQQAATPTPTGYNPSAIKQFDLAKYYKNPIGAAREEASKALNELRRNPRPIGL
jgi:hypothetical protein